MDKPHKRLNVWKSAMALSVDLYKMTECFPRAKARYLIDQICRSAMSIPSNIAEGAGRQTGKEFVRFLHMSKGSLSELDTQLELSKQLGFLKRSTWSKLDGRLMEIDKMLSGLIRQKRDQQGV